MCAQNFPAEVSIENGYKIVMVPHLIFVEIACRIGILSQRMFNNFTGDANSNNCVLQSDQQFQCSTG